MNVAVVGAGRIGANIARRLTLARHRLTLSFARDTAALAALASEIGARVAPPAQAVADAQIVVISVPWAALGEALEQIGSLEGKVVIDTTNQYGPEGLQRLPDAQTAGAHNAARMAGARYTKSFNTLTAVFQIEAATRSDAHRVVQWVCGEDLLAKRLVIDLVQDAGYAGVDIGGLAQAAAIEAPRRPGAVYGEEWRLPEALQVVQAIRSGQPIPATPNYAEPPP